MLQTIDVSLRNPLLDVLAHDPRPQYHDDPQRVYGMKWAQWEVRFQVDGNRLQVLQIESN